MLSLMPYVIKEGSFNLEKIKVFCVGQSFYVGWCLSTMDDTEVFKLKLTKLTRICF